MSRTEREALAGALFHLDYLDRYAHLDLERDVVIDAIALRLAAMIDALGTQPIDVLTDLFGESWPAMRGLRNRIAHGYHAVSPGALRLTVNEERPAVRAIIERRLASLAGV